jgi:hypothetical protein
LRDGPGPAAVELDAAVEVKGVHADGADLPYAVDAEARKLRVDLSPLGTGAAERSFTVDDEAASSRGLLAYDGRDDDPVAARVVSTESEPLDGVNWLVARHHPGDRALFRVAFEGGLAVVCGGAHRCPRAVAQRHRRIAAFGPSEHVW